MPTPQTLSGEKIVIAGPTSQVAFPLACRLAENNEVYGLARFRNPADRERVEAAGITAIAADMADDTFDAVPEDCTYVLNFAVVKTGDFAYDLAANAQGAGRLLARCKRAKAFLHVSSAGVYEYAGRIALTESSPLGDNHRSLFPTYSIAKIAAETVVSFASRQWGVPSTIARLSVPYGDNGGWPWFHLMMMREGHAIPVHAEQPNTYNPLHEDDYIAQIPALLHAATVGSTTVNWGGAPVSIEEWCAYLGELTGLEPRFEADDSAFGSLQVDLTRFHEIAPPAQVNWKDGLARMVAALNPELLI